MLAMVVFSLNSLLVEVHLFNDPTFLLIFLAANLFKLLRVLVLVLLPWSDLWKARIQMPVSSGLIIHVSLVKGVLWRVLKEASSIARTGCGLLLVVLLVLAYEIPSDLTLIEFFVSLSGILEFLDSLLLHLHLLLLSPSESESLGIRCNDL